MAHDGVFRSPHVNHLQENLLEAALVLAPGIVDDHVP